MFQSTLPSEKESDRCAECKPLPLNRFQSTLPSEKESDSGGSSPRGAGLVSIHAPLRKGERLGCVQHWHSQWSVSIHAPLRKGERLTVGCISRRRSCCFNPRSPPKRRATDSRVYILASKLLFQSTLPSEKESDARAGLRGRAP